MILKTFEEFINESHPATPWSASLNNTPGMGNVVSSNVPNTFGAFPTDSADQDGTKRFHPDLKVEKSDAWMRPSGDYSNRSWLVPNYNEYQRLHQSNARFSIGDIVQCLNPDLPCYGMTGKIVAFEDNTIRFEIMSSTTGVGQTAKQYRCHAGSLKRIV